MRGQPVTVGQTRLRRLRKKLEELHQQAPLDQQRLQRYVTKAVEELRQLRFYGTPAFRQPEAVQNLTWLQVLDTQLRAGALRLQEPAHWLLVREALSTALAPA